MRLGLGLGLGRGGGVIASLLQYLFNGTDTSGFTFTGGGQTVADWQKSFVTLDAGTPAVEGGRLSFYSEDGAVRGPDIAINGDFDTDSDWIKPSGCTITGGEAVFTSGGLLRQNVAMEAGEFYEFIYEVSSRDSGTTQPTRVQGFSSSDSSPSRYDDGEHREIIYFPSGSSAYFVNGQAGFVGAVTRVEVRKITPVWVDAAPYQLAITGDSIAQRQTDNLSSEFPGDTTNGRSLDGFPVQITDNALGSQTFAWVNSTGMPAAVATNPQAILIHCGVNDISDGRTWAQVESDLDGIKAQWSGVLFISEILPWTNGTDEQNVTVRTWNDNLATWCAANDATLIATHDAMGQVRVSTGELDDLKTIYDSDGVHPTSAGAYILWDLWFDAIEASVSTSGRTLQPLQNVTTANGVVKNYLRYNTRQDTTAYSLGDKVAAEASDGVDRWYECTTAGTTGTGTAMPTSGTVADGAVTWTYGGYHTIKGYLGGGARTNYFLNSETPVDQTVDLTSPGTGDYTLSVHGSGDVAVAANTATGTGFGTASDGTDVTFNLTGAGTVDLTITGGTPDIVMLEKGSFASSPIPTAGTSVTRPATVLSHATEEVIRSQGWGGRFLVNPIAAGQTGWLVNSYTDANNEVGVLVEPTQMTFRKRDTGTDTDAVLSYTHAKDTPCLVDIYQSTAGMGIRVAEWNGASWDAFSDWTEVTTAAGKADMVLASTFELLSRDGDDHLFARCPEFFMPVFGSDPKSKLGAIAAGDIQ